MNRIVVIVIIILLLALAGWGFARRNSPPAAPPTPTPFVDTKANDEKLIELRSAPLKNKLDDSRAKVQQDQQNYNNALNAQ